MMSGVVIGTVVGSIAAVAIASFVAFIVYNYGKPSKRDGPKFGQGELFGPSVEGQRTYFHSTALKPGEMAVQLPPTYPHMTFSEHMSPQTSVFRKGDPVLIKTLTGYQRGTISGNLDKWFHFINLPNGNTTLAMRAPARIVKTPKWKMSLVNKGSRQALGGRELPTELLAMIGSFLGLPEESIHGKFSGSTRRSRRRM